MKIRICFAKIRNKTKIAMKKVRKKTLSLFVALRINSYFCEE
ncbi:hypothetical protein HMPREF1551_01902 [Capnocytophaga sp. oral taxon 863 str. F0517]|nr:hypothetical protein HMPREF1551_01902 [Capnocytophaga sp. oral taxon 863 str. F0517]